MNIENIIYKRFDLVQIVCADNISYINSPIIGRTPANGIWQVSAVLGSNLLIIKDNITVRIPAHDVLKVYDYSIKNFTANFGRLVRHGEDERKEEPPGQP